MQNNHSLLKKKFIEIRLYVTGLISQNFAAGFSIMATLLVACFSTTEFSIASSILLLSSCYIFYIYYNKLHYFPKFLVYNLITLLVVFFIPGVSGVYFLCASVMFMSAYFFKKDLYLMHFGFVSIIGFSLSFLFFKFFLLPEFKNYLFFGLPAEFKANIDAATLKLIVTLGPIDPTINSELLFPISKPCVDELVKLFLDPSCPIAASTNFVLIYYHFLAVIVDSIPYIQAYFFISIV